MWIERDISSSIEQNKDPIQVLRGPRQCGKSSLLLRLDKNFQEVSLDDIHYRQLANSDPELFLSQFGDQKLLIDEAQYAPELFPALKRRVDLIKRSGRTSDTLFRLTGSNQIMMDQRVKESLAGRASFFDLNTLSVAEIVRSQNLPVQEILYRGGWPELIADPTRNEKKFLDDYINSYIEKDIVLSAGISKQREFLLLLKLIAGRVGNIVDFASLGRDAGIDSATAKMWLSVLERMQVIALVPAFSTNLSTRLIKSPKVYFMDTGLACRLQGWTSSQPILTSPQQGALFENLVFTELQKMNSNYQLGWNIFHWRSREGEEVDFLVQKNSFEFFFVESKVSPETGQDISRFPEIKKVFKKQVPPCFQCNQEGSQILLNRVPIRLLQGLLMQKA